MTPTELTRRVTALTCVIAAALASIAAWVGGLPVAIGIAAGGALAALNFRWLAAHAGSAAERPGGGGLWLLGTGARWLVLGAAAAALLASGAAHPLGLLGGLALLPCALVAEGLRAARAGR